MSDERNWLKLAVSRGLQALVVLHLEGGPGAETVKQTAAIWYRVIRGWPIAWDEGLDSQRLEAGFLALASQAQRWPAPSQLRPLLPQRVYADLQLAAPDYPPEKAAENLRKIRALLAGKLSKQLGGCDAASK